MPTPATLPNTPNALPSPARLSEMFGGSLKHSDGINQMLADILQAWRKIGTTGSPAGDTPVANRVLTSLANGQSSWAQVVGAMIANATMLDANFQTNSIHANKIQTGTIGTAQIADGQINGGVDIQAATMADANFGVGTIHGNKIQPGTIGTNEIADGSLATLD